MYDRAVSATPLQRRLYDDPKPQAPGPLDAFRLARRAFMAGERLDMQVLSAELGVNRATLYRWVGSKELLLGEVIGALARETLQAADRDLAGTGADHVARVATRVLEQIHAFEPMRRFLERDPEYALRVLTSKQSTVQRSSVAAMRALLAEQVDAGVLQTPLDLDDLAYVMIRIGESFLYSDLIIGSEPDVARAGDVYRVLLGAHA
jgi:AcrR family transcriptional regulator